MAELCKGGHQLHDSSFVSDDMTQIKLFKEEEEEEEGGGEEGEGGGEDERLGRRGKRLMKMEGGRRGEEKAGEEKLL